MHFGKTSKQFTELRKNQAAKKTIFYRTNISNTPNERVTSRMPVADSFGLCPFLLPHEFVQHCGVGRHTLAHTGAVGLAQNHLVAHEPYKQHTTIHIIKLVNMFTIYFSGSVTCDDGIAAELGSVDIDHGHRKQVSVDEHHTAAAQHTKHF